MITQDEFKTIRVDLLKVKQALSLRDRNSPLTEHESTVLNDACKQKKISMKEIKKKLSINDNPEQKYKFREDKILRNLLQLCSGSGSSSSSVTHLDLSFTSISPEIFQEFKTNLPDSLEHLNISATGLDDQSIDVLFAALAARPSLESLSMRSNKLTNFGVARMVAALSNTKISTLDLSSCGAEAEAIGYCLSSKTFKFEMEKNKTLGTTSIKWSLFNEEDEKLMPDNEQKEQQQPNNQSFFKVQQCTTLKRLTLAHISSFSLEVSFFSALQESSITHFAVHCSNIAETDFVELVHSSNVVDLALIQCELSSSTMKSFIEGLSDSNLELLNMSYTNFAAFDEAKGDLLSRTNQALLANELEKRCAAFDPFEFDDETNLPENTSKKDYQKARYVALQKELKDKYITLQKECALSMKDLGELFKLHMEKSKITTLDMMYCSLSDDFLTEISTTMSESSLTHMNVKGNKFTKVGLASFASVLSHAHCKLQSINFSNGFAPERPSVTTVAYQLLNAKTRQAYEAHWSRKQTTENNQESVEVAKIFLQAMGDRKDGEMIPTTLKELHGAALNLSGHLGKTSGEEDFVFHAHGTDAHFIAKQDNSTFLDYLHTTHHYSGVERREKRGINSGNEKVAKEEKHNVEMKTYQERMEEYGARLKSKK